MVELHLLAEDGTVRVRQELGDVPMYIGRGRRCDWVIDDRAVSSTHAVLFVVDGRVCVEDLGSKNGTRVSGEQILGVRRLRHGDRITLGGTVHIEVQGSPGTGTSTMLERDQREPEGFGELLATLEVRDRGIAGEVGILVRGLCRDLDAERWARTKLGTLARAQSEQGLMEELVRIAAEETGAQIAWALRWEGTPTSDDVSFSALARHGGTGDLPAPDRISRSIVARAANAQGPLWTDDARADHRFEEARSVHQQALRSVGCLPIGRRGALYVADASKLGRFTPENRARLAALCGCVGALIQDEEAEQADGPLEESVPGLVGRTPAMIDLFRTVRAFAPMPWPVLILGESGTGKEGVARAVHVLSRLEGEFVAVNCGGIPPDLADSTLFGHERGSFTGADRRHEGFAERVGRGTLFLDEVGELAPHIQVKLLRLLQERTFERVGGHEPLRFSGRVVAATHRSIDDPEERGAFRSDLYHRLAACVIRVPALRDRREDIALLARHLLQRVVEQDLPGHAFTLSDRAVADLSARAWPGNVRDLENKIKDAIAHCLYTGGNVLEPEHFGAAGSDDGDPADGVDLAAATLAFQHRMVQDALDASEGNRSEAARKLGVSRQSLYRLLDKQ